MFVDMMSWYCPMRTLMMWWSLDDGDGCLDDDCWWCNSCWWLWAITLYGGAHGPVDYLMIARWLVQLRWWWSDVHDDAWSIWWWSRCTWWWPWGHVGDDIMMMMLALWHGTFIGDGLMSFGHDDIHDVTWCSCLWWGTLFPYSFIHLTYLALAPSILANPCKNPHTPFLAHYTTP